MKIHKEGFKIITLFLVGFVLLNTAIIVFVKIPVLSWFFIAASLILLFFVTWFFRVPPRKIQLNDKHIIAPSDGKIVVIEEVFEKEFFKEKRLQISIFMSPLNVHQNRAPVQGKVVYSRHKNGHFYPAFVPKSSEENERSTTVFEMKNGVQVLSRQIAGAVARRIVNYSKVGDFYAQGQEYGFIRFGSRVDVFLPTDVKVMVNLEDKSIGGKTILALFK